MNTNLKEFFKPTKKENKKQKLTGTYSLPYIIKMEWQSALFLLCLIAILPILMGIVIWRDPASIIVNIKSIEGLLMLTISILLPLWIIRFIYALEIRLLEDRIIYRTLYKGILFKTQAVFYSELAKIEIKIGNIGKGWGLEHLHIYNKSFKEILVIGLTSFSRKDWAVIIDAIVKKAPSIEIDHFAEQVKEGYFKPINYEDIRQFWQIMWWVFLLSLGIPIIIFLEKLLR